MQANSEDHYCSAASGAASHAACDSDDSDDEDTGLRQFVRAR